MAKSDEQLLDEFALTDSLLLALEKHFQVRVNPHTVGFESELSLMLQNDS